MNEGLSNSRFLMCSLLCIARWLSLLSTWMKSRDERIRINGAALFCICIYTRCLELTYDFSCVDENYWLMKPSGFQL